MRGARTSTPRCRGTELSVAGPLLVGAAVALGAVGILTRWRARVARRFEAGDLARRPRDANGVVVGAAAFRLEHPGTDRAVLVLHGFNDTPQSMRHLATRLYAAGYTVHVPRLPGHGGSLRELAADARAPRWRRATERALADLRRTHRYVFVCGQSMGGALTVELAARHPDLPAIALLAPFIGLDPAMERQFRLARLSPVPYLRSPGGERSIHDPEARRQALGPGIVTARALLGLRDVALRAESLLSRMKVPCLYVQSVHDNRVSEAFGLRHFKAIAATLKKQLWLSGSGHIISADYEKDVVADAVIAWFGDALARNSRSG